MFNKVLAGEVVSRKRIFQIIGVVTIVNMLSRLFGFFREVVIGYHFGTTSLADSVILAYTIPNFLYMVLGGAVTTAYISIYNKITNQLHKQQFHETIFTYLFTFTSLLTVFLLAFPDQTIRFFFAGQHPSEIKTTSELFMFMAPSIIFLIFSMWLSGILNVQNKFYSSSLATLANNVGFVVIAVILYPLMNAYAYGLGAVLGAAIMFIILFYYVRKDGHVHFRFRFAISENKYIFRMLKISLPILLGGATLQFYFFIHRMFASQLQDGYVAALNYASKLVQLPQTILMTAVTTVIYPLLAKKAADKDYNGISQIYFKGLQMLVIFIVPISIFVYLYAQEIVKIIFEYGSFTSQSTKMTAGMLKIFVIGMFAHAANLFVTRFFYALERSMMPVVSGIVAVFGVNVLIIVLFIKEYGASAIAWGTTIGSLFQFVVLSVAAVFRLGLKADIRDTAMKLFIFIVILIIVMYTVQMIVNFNHYVIHVGAGFVIFLVVTYILLRQLGLLDRNILKR
jgi:putative peptidoglycan lipid II flippase